MDNNRKYLLSYISYSKYFYDLLNFYKDKKLTTLITNECQKLEVGNYETQMIDCIYI